MPLPLFYGIYLNAFKLTPVPEVVWVSWYDDPQTGVYLGWRTSDPIPCTVRYGVSETLTDAITIETPSDSLHIANLTGLTPNTKYFYEVQGEGWGPVTGSFRTAPLYGDTFTSVFIADTQPKVGPGWHSRMASTLATGNYDFVAMIGDFVEDGYEFEWNYFFQEAGHYLDTTPLVPVLGNHEKPRDLNNDGIYEYPFMDYFPQTVDEVKNLNPDDIDYQFYYSFNWSNVHFQILHFPQLGVTSMGHEDYVSPGQYNRAFTEDHIQWIKDDLERAQDMPFRISMFHCPITGPGFHGPNHVLENELLPILHEYNVTATIHGHAHHYSRSLLENPIHPNNDLTAFIVGTGGGLTDVGLRALPTTQALAGSPIYLELNATGTELVFTAFTLDGDVVDQAVLTPFGGLAND